MSAPPIVVLGAGVAGASAALAAAAASAKSGGVPEILVLDGGSGASTLAPGALDGDSGDSGDSGDATLPVAGFALGSCLLATVAGTIRRAAGRDLALLDLAAVPRGLVAVPTSAHHGWDARLLAAQWNDSPLAGRFVAVDATLLRFTDERDMPDADLARRHDDPARLAWLADRLRDALANAKTAGQPISAVILPPWLGVEAPRAAALSQLLGVPAGEALALNLGPSGLRFEAARDRAFAARGVQVRRARATAIRVSPSGELQVHLDDPGEDPVHAAAVILAMGGLVGGGLRYTPSGSDLAFAVPVRGRATLELEVALDGDLGARATVGLGGRPLLAPGSLFGASPEQLAWPFTRPAPIERAGLLHDATTLAVAGDDRRPLFVAGELAADLPRTWLAAVFSGERAGAAAARAVLAITKS